MFNITGGEVVIILILALVILGPEKLPDAVRKFGKLYAEAKKMSTGFQTELRDALEEPMRELRETANLIKDSIDEPTQALRETAQQATDLAKSVSDPFANATGFSAGPSTPSSANPDPASTSAEAAPTSSEPTVPVPRVTGQDAEPSSNGSIPPASTLVELAPPEAGQMLPAPPPVPVVPSRLNGGLPPPSVQALPTPNGPMVSAPGSSPLPPPVPETPST